MAPTLLLIRHAQAVHNATGKDDIPDPPLTELGKRQCSELHDVLKNDKLANQVELIIASPMRRTLETTVLGLGWLIKERGIKVLANAKWQENGPWPCDTGSNIAEIAPSFASVDFSEVDPLYPDKTTGPNNPYAFTKKAVLARGQSALQELYGRSEKVIAVVSHSGFLRTAVTNRNYFNADYRIFDFDEDAIKQNGVYRLKEWQQTEKSRGGMGRSEPGYFGIEERDFPPEETEVHAEAAPEVPKQ